MPHTCRAWACSREVSVDGAVFLLVTSCLADTGLGGHFDKMSGLLESLLQEIKELSPPYPCQLFLTTHRLCEGIRVLLVLPSLVTTIMETPGLRKADCGESCSFCGASCWGAGVSLSHTRLCSGVVPRCSVVGLCLSWPENHVPLWLPSSTCLFFAAGLYPL